MGKNISSKQKETLTSSLIEIIYSDSDIIASLDSQFRGGTEESRSTESAKREGDSGKLGVSAVFQASTDSHRELSSRITRSISPHDSKVLELIDEINIPKVKETAVLNDGQLMYSTGAIQFFDMPFTHDLFCKLEKIGVINELANQEYSPEEAIKAGGEFLVGKNKLEYIKQIISFLPQHPYFILCLKNARSFRIPIIKEHLRQPMSILQTLYGTGLTGEWDIVGIYNKISCHDQKATENVVGSLKDLYKCYNDVTLATGLSNEIIAPILIYRKLQF
ncbi:hypothetical protein [Christensenella tenuis]|jgi:hypothetical protein|uniref:Uncharacterized protein n=1 Tax=Christensenella tenuis TaxID=2763033 RepID=A0ABR7EFA8_9FIRM|nr:hypothetical protein [Christensenella tenuis]MBC5648464.1 hypothetical protein [Christensenella tenuis]